MFVALHHPMLCPCNSLEWRVPEYKLLYTKEAWFAVSRETGDDGKNMSLKLC